MTTATKAGRVMEQTKTIAGGALSRTIKAVMPPIAEVASFLTDRIGWFFQEYDAWKKPYMGFRREFLRETIDEFAVVVDGKPLVCRKTTRVFAIRGKNRREWKPGLTYREPTEEDKKRDSFRKVWGKTG